jgi:proteasome assembly chaperone (PAC2) family protein
MPRNLLYQTEAGADGPRLTVFIGESQPNSGAYSFAQELMVKAQEMGVDRVITFASMASQLHPSEHPRVFGAATHENLVDDLRKLEVQPLKEGQIGGLNGVLLGAAAERHLPGLCLMGEIPFFAAGVPNPKAAKAVLDAMALLTALDLDVDALNPHIEAIDRVLNNMMERMQSEQPSDHEESEGSAGQSDAGDAERRDPAGLDKAARQLIETLFAEARSDRSRAMVLKQELDRLNVFAQYEDRFLDLFRRAE